MPYKRTGLAVMRIQPLHKGHTALINQMIQDCDTVVIGLGSSQKSREKHDPYTVEERIQMLRNVYADRIKIVPLKDIGLVNVTDEWVLYIFDKLKKLGLPEPTDYYSGSHADASWYKSHFWYDGVVSPKQCFQVDGKCMVPRILHIMDRQKNIYPAATELRTFLETRTDGWKEWIPAVNHSLVQGSYPEEFKIG